MASKCGDALNRGQTSENEPDVKQGPGGLRDLQRALSVNTLASGRPAAIAEPALIEAHRFLWLVRCHLHLLVGRAEDRLEFGAPTRRRAPAWVRRASPSNRGVLSGPFPATVTNVTQFLPAEILLAACGKHPPFFSGGPQGQRIRLVLATLQ